MIVDILIKKSNFIGCFASKPKLLKYLKKNCDQLFIYDNSIQEFVSLNPKILKKTLSTRKILNVYDKNGTIEALSNKNLNKTDYYKFAIFKVIESTLNKEFEKK